MSAVSATQSSKGVRCFGAAPARSGRFLALTFRAALCSEERYFFALPSLSRKDLPCNASCSPPFHPSCRVVRLAMHVFVSSPHPHTPPLRRSDWRTPPSAQRTLEALRFALHAMSARCLVARVCLQFRFCCAYIHCCCTAWVRWVCARARVKVLEWSEDFSFWLRS